MSFIILLQHRTLFFPEVQERPLELLQYKSLRDVADEYPEDDAVASIVKRVVIRSINSEILLLIDKSCFSSTKIEIIIFLC